MALYKTVSGQYCIQTNILFNNFTLYVIENAASVWIWNGLTQLYGITMMDGGKIRQ